MSEEIRARVDFTSERSPNQRRLDTLAMLLNGKSACVAVCVINNKFHITANELYVNSKENNEISTWIKTVIDYFKDLCNKKSVDSQKFNVLFKKACEQA